MNHNLELTIKLENGKTDYDFVNVKANSREEAIKTHVNCLKNRINRAKSGNKIFASYAKWQGFEIK